MRPLLALRVSLQVVMLAGLVNNAALARAAG